LPNKCSICAAAGLDLHCRILNIKKHYMKTRKNPLTSGSKLALKGLLLSFCLFHVGSLFSQEQVYDNFEGQKVLRYSERFGVLDSAVKNPAPNAVNKSATCAMYVRDGSKKFANIKMTLDRKITGVDKYATYEGIPPRLKMKVYTTAPAGTLVEILLGSKRGNNDYPAGTHSQYQAYTSVSNEWEELEFKFAQIPQGSETAANQIDQVVLLFNPNSSTSDTYYFDDLTGPGLEAAATVSDDKAKTEVTPAEHEKAKGKKAKSQASKSGSKKNK
jgi:hypothetical protein